MSAQAATVLPYRPPRARADATAWLGLLLFLGSWAMMFSALFFAYGFVRLHAGEWPPLGAPRLPLLLPGANTLVIGVSSVALLRAVSAARAGRISQVLPAVGAAIVLGLLFLSLQFLLWSRLWTAGLRIDGGPYPSVFWALTVFHALHVLVGLAGLAYVAIRSGQGAYGPARHVALRLWSGFWHFVGAVWILIYVAVFVI